LWSIWGSLRLTTLSFDIYSWMKPVDSHCAITKPQSFEDSFVQIFRTENFQSCCTPAILRTFPNCWSWPGRDLHLWQMWISNVSGNCPLYCHSGEEYWSEQHERPEW
jgi:hypothetical protein